MLRVSKSSIIFFVFLSMVTAFVYHRWFRPQATGAGDFSSEIAGGAEKQEQKQKQDLKKLAQNLPEQLKKINGAGKGDAKDCQCTLAGVEEEFLQTEDPKSCGPERNFLEAGLGQVDQLFREERAKSSAEFPKVCLTYIMRSTYANAEAENSEFFASCKNFEGNPIRGSRKPCISKTYVNTVYNTFGDLTDCMSIPSRDYLPKLAMESGFHMNIRGGRFEVVKKPDGTEVREMVGADTGIAQFVTQSIDSANSDFKRYQREIMNSDKASCKRLSTAIKNLNPISSEVEKRCGLVVPPQNPLMSLFYMMIKYKQDDYALDFYMAKQENDILRRMNDLGLTSDMFDKAKLKQMLIVLGYNSGASSAVILLKNYLEAVASEKRKLTLADFDIGAESSIYRKINDKTQRLRRLESNSDEDWQRRKTEFETMVGDLSKTNVSFKPKAKLVTVTEPKVGTYETYELQFRPGHLSFAAYSMLYQTSGNGGYLSKVHASAMKLNKKFKEGVCVPDSYLAL